MMIMAMLAISCTNSDRVYSGSDDQDSDYSTSDVLSSIEVSGPITLKLTNTMEEKDFNVTAPSDIYSLVDVSISGGCLKIEYDCEDDLLTALESEIVVTANLDQYSEVTASDRAYVKYVDNGSFILHSVTLSDNAIFEGSLTCSILSFDMSDVSTATISGSVYTCNATLSTGSTLTGDGFSCENLDVTASSSNVKLFSVSYSVTGDLSESSILSYTGAASSSVNVDSTSKVETY